MSNSQDNDDSPNPPLRVGAAIPPPSLSELKAWHSYQGTLHRFLIDIGYYYYHPAPGDRSPSRDTGRDR